MTWKPLYIRGLSFNGPNKNTASLEFDRGLNIIRGVSDTGKSFVVNSIDFLLGSSSPLTEITERDGYDKARLVVQPAGKEPVTIQRSSNGGGFIIFDGVWLSGNPDSEGIVLEERHSADKENTLSHFLLSSIGLENQFIRRNKGGETNSLSFRNVVNLSVVKEDAIIKEGSPFLTGRPISRTPEYSVFKRLLTGIDDSALVAQRKAQEERAARQAERIATERNNAAKVELIDEFILELQAGLAENGLERSQVEAQLLTLNREIQAQQESLSQTQIELDDYLERRRIVLNEIEGLKNRISEISSLLARFELLKEHYRVDLNRLASIQESGSLLVYYERTVCPLCGTPPDEQHQNEGCDGDIERVVYGATAEISKVEKLSDELTDTASQLEEEAADLRAREEGLLPQLDRINQRIQSVSSPFQSAQNTFSELIQLANEWQKTIDSFDRIATLREKRVVFLVSPDPVEEAEPINIQPGLSKAVLGEYSKVVEKLLQAWNFPDSDQVYFDEKSKDLVINDKPRGSRGKGHRAIIHAAMNIGLMEFCKD